MAASALNLDLSDIAVDELESPVPIANALSTIQSTLNNLGNIHVASDAAIATSKLELGAGSSTVIALNNNIALQAKLAAGTLVNLLKLDTSDNVLERANINGTMVNDTHEETYTVNVGTLGASAQSAQQTMTFRKAFANTNYHPSGIGFSTEGNGVIVYGRVLNTGSLTFYIQNMYAGGNQTNCTAYIRVRGA